MKPHPEVAAVVAGAEIERLVEVLRTADARLEELLGGQVDTLFDRSGSLVVLRRAQAHLRSGDAVRQAAILSALPAHVALLDAKGVILAVNTGWQQFAKANGLAMEGHGIGANYLSVCDTAIGAGSDQAAQVAAGIRAVLDASTDRYELEYPCHSMAQERWFCMTVVAVADGAQSGAVVMHTSVTARHQADDRLARLSEHTEKRERLLNTTLSSITDYAFALDREGRLLFANQPLLALWKVKPQTVLGKRLDELHFPPDTARRLQQEIEQVSRTGIALSGAVTFPGRDLANRYFEYTFSGALGDNGQVDFVVGCARDITARRTSELALAESAARFRILADAMPLMVWAADQAGDMTYFNPKWRVYSGLGAGESVREAWSACLLPGQRAGWLEVWNQARQSGDAFSFEASLRRADGVYRWWMVRVVPVPETVGGSAWLGTCTDIHELKTSQFEVSRANRELEQQRAELRVLFDVVPACVAFKDAQNNFLRVNARAAANYGRTVAQMEGHPVAEFIPPEVAAAHYAVDLEILRTGQPVLGRIERAYGDGNSAGTWIEKDKVPYRDAAGNIIGIVMVFRDVTERTRDRDALRELNADLERRVLGRTEQLELARHEAEQANRAKSEFLATMSHEIRTPLTGLLGMLELLSLSPLVAEQLSTLNVARDSGAALMHMIDDVLDFAKIEANRMDLMLVAASVRDVVEKACRLHSQIASRKGVDLQFRVAPAIGRDLSFDPFRLGQILNNFISNAIKFTDAGVVDVEVDLLGRGDETERLRFVVRDTGIGMTPQQLGRLFAPFAQASSEITERYGGSGLGLMISRRLAELMGGTVEIASESGRGTALTLDLSFDVCRLGAEAVAPAVAGAAQLEAVMTGRRAAPTVEQAEADRSLVLVADDHPTNRMVLLRQLASLGYAAEAREDGDQALEAWQSGRFAAVITDCNMPRMSGYQLAHAIRAGERQGASARAPVIAYTANTMAATLDRCRESGMDDCLIKPANLTEVSRKMDRWLPLPRDRSRVPVAMPRAEMATAAISAAAAAVTAENSATQGLLNLALLAEISGGNPQLLTAFLHDFRRLSDADATKLRDAVHQHNFAAAGATAHRLRGATAMVGASLLGDVCGRLESAAAAADAALLAETMRGFELELLHLATFVDARSADSPSRA